MNPLRSLVFVLVTTLAGTAVAQVETRPTEPPRSAPTQEITAQVLGAEAGSPANLGVASLLLRLDGRTAEIVAVEPIAGPLRIVIYLDQPLSSTGALARGATALAERARQLTDIGTVEVVLADPRPRWILPPSRDPALVESTLSQGFLAPEGKTDELRGLRRKKLQQLSGFTTTAAPKPNLDAFLRRAVHEEIGVVQRQQDYLLSWLAAEGTSGPRALFLLTEGFDLDPLAFYRRQAGREARTQLAALDNLESEGVAAPLPALARTTGRTLAALGWPTWTLTLGGLEGADPGEGGDDLERFEEAARDPEFRSAPAWSSISLERIRRKLKGEETLVEVRGRTLLAPEESLLPVAEPTGGYPVMEDLALTEVLDALPGRLRVRYRSQLDRGYEVSLRSRQEGVTLRAATWGEPGLPEAVTAARARRLLAGDLAGIETLAAGGETEGGSLPVVAALLLPEAAGSEASSDAPAVVEARTDLAALTASPEGGGPSDTPARWRVSVAYAGSRGESDQGLRGLLPQEELVEPGTGEEWLYRRELELPPGVERVAVILENLNTGRWGGSLASILGAGSLEASLGPSNAANEDDDSYQDATLQALAEAAFLPSPRAIRLLQPAGAVLQGKVRFQTLTSREDIDRVEFLLGEEVVEVIKSAPFHARIDLGRFPQPRTLRAVAYNADGRELGRDALVINDGGRSFRVRILEPTPGPRVGAVDVDLDLSVPVDRRLDRVEYFWQDRKMATRYAPPYRQRVMVPQHDGSGFIRVVAHLDDGRNAEDVVVLNAIDFADRLQISLVELYTVVTDGNGRPMEGLKAEDFEIRENGVAQELESFDDAGDLPLTLGLALDSSASMFIKLPAVQQAAGDFVRGFLSGRDRAFLVDFDTQPRLSRELTSDLDRVVGGIESLTADGDTHLWESIVFALLELQGVAGKKAVVVFSDGAEEEESLSYRSCYQFARRLGVPIYLIVLHPGLARGDDLSPGVKSFTKKLERLTEAVGGRVYYIPNTYSLDHIYREIDDELRSQYLLTYYPKDPGVEGEWREVKVAMPGHPGLDARTIAGYFPQW